ncbi:MAG: MaoC family dehydratase [Chloroflexi bacterium]|nr:MaoC family dehydratase [Chloroflexota bacterium]
MPTKEGFGRYLEDFRVGELIEHWPGRTITEADDVLFCMLTMNHHPLHSDAKYAADTQFGQRIVAGPLVYSLVFGMTVPVVSGKAIANLATSEMRHLAPVFHGDTLYARTEVLAVRDSKSQPDRGIVTVKTEGVNQKGAVVLEFQRAVMLPKRAAAAE